MKFEFKSKLIVCVIIFFISRQISAITLVYNMRIRRAFVLGLPKVKRPTWIFTSVPIVYKRDRHIIDEQSDEPINICEKRLTLGSIFNLRYKPTKHWWAEITTGLENEALRAKGTSTFKVSRTGLDDIVLTGGYNIFFNKNSQFVIYGLAGFPTRRKITLKERFDTLVGTRFYTIGVGTEFSHDFIHELKKSFVVVFQNRFLHLFNRRFEPILPQGDKIQPGNVIDLLFTMQYRYRINIFEIGYNPTFFTNQAIIMQATCESTEEKVKSKSFVRHSVYGSYAHLIKKFPILKKPAVIGCGFSFARSTKFDTKIYSAWLSFSLIF